VSEVIAIFRQLVLFANTAAFFCSLLGLVLPVAECLGGAVKKGVAKNSSLIKNTQLLCDNRWVYHTNEMKFSTSRKWLFLLVELRNLSGNHHSLKSPFIINSQKV